MLISSIVFILFSFVTNLVQCEIPNLNVRKMDQSLIAQKRQDTFDMCRIFTEESAKIHTKPKIIKSYIHMGTKPSSHNRRHKRGIDVNYNLNPTLTVEEAKRVENIVDKLYDDMEAKGEKIAYTHNTIPTTTNVKTLVQEVKENTTKAPSRKFFFAPELVVGPAPEELIRLPKISHFYEKARWKHGIVPYFIDSKTYDAQLQDIIMKAFDYVEKATCIRMQRLRERPTDRKSLTTVDWVYITNPSGVRQCVHSNEKRKIDGVQMSVLGYDCMSMGDIVHEVMHILGFPHEHTRSDRDKYISINWDNIKPGYRKYFEIATVAEQYTLENLPYDYASILHYPPRAFSKNGQVTISAQTGVKIGQREGLSEIDLEKVGTIYSGECVERNREYLLKTCPSVVKTEAKATKVEQKDIDNYFKDRIWEFGIVNYKLRDSLEFSIEERENIKAVIQHIEKETCIQFRDVSVDEQQDKAGSDNNQEEKSPDVEGQNEYSEGQDEDGPLISNEPEENVEPNYDDKRPDTVSTTSTTRKPRDDSQTHDDNDGSNEIQFNLPEYSPRHENSEELGLSKIVNTDPNIPRINKRRSVSENEIKKVDDQNEKYKPLFGIVEPKNANESFRSLIESKMHSKLTNITKVTVEATPTKTGSKATPKKPLKTESRRNLKRSPKAKRRHAANVMTLTRSAMPGCKCPPPGKRSADMVLEINADCFNSVNDLLHLFVHVLGLDHQHNMHDRDSYLHIMWNNLTPDIKEEMKNKLPPAASLGFPYDYQSVMHYPWLQIKDGVTNIMYPIWNDGWAMGHWQGLSSFDVQKLNLLYFQQCTERKQQSQAYRRRF